MKCSSFKLTDRINLNIIQSDEWSTGCVSVSFLQRLTRDNAALNTLVPRVLRRASAKYPTPSEVSDALAELYGARIIPAQRKFGDVTATGFICDFINREQNAASVISLACELLLAPKLVNNCFDTDIVKSEKAHLGNEIRAIKNNKSGYAYRRAVLNTFPKSGFGISEFGEDTDLDTISSDLLFRQYRKLITNAPVELFCCSNMCATDVRELFEAVLTPIIGSEREEVSVSCASPVPNKQNVFEYEDMEQAILLIGMRSERKTRFPNRVLSTIIGGSVASKLFSNVRERLSLCYSTQSVFDSFSNTIYLFAGIAPKNLRAAYEATLAEFDSEITEEELIFAKRRLIDSLKTALDLPISIESEFLSESVAKSGITPFELLGGIRDVELADVRDAQSAFTHEINYVLSGKEAHLDETRLLPEA